MSTIDLGTENGNFILHAKDDYSDIKITLTLSDTEALSEGVIKTIAILKKEIEEEKKPLFTTEDGVEIFNNTSTLYAVGLDFSTATSNKWDFEQCETEGYKLFFYKKNADEYIIKNKRLFTYEEMKKANIDINWCTADIYYKAKERACNG